MLGLCVAVGLLAAVEGALRLAYGAPEQRSVVAGRLDRWSSLFMEKGGLAYPAFQDDLALGTFPVVPDPAVPRIAFLGESSVRGGSGHGAEEWEFPILVGNALAEGGLRVEVLNFGMPGADSAGVLQITEAAVRYRPRIAVLYLGHNDVMTVHRVGAYGITGRAAARIRVALDSLRLMRGFSDWMAARKRFSTVPPVTGRERAPDRARYLWMEELFRSNLAQIVDTLRKAGARPILVVPVSNAFFQAMNMPLCPEVVPDSGLSRWRDLPILLPTTDLILGERAVQYAPECPEALFLRGTARWAHGDGRGANADLRAARDGDLAGMRATTGVQQVVRQVGASRRVPVVDLEALLGAAGPVPEAFFIDFVHLTREGHEAVASGVLPDVRKALESLRR